LALRLFLRLGVVVRNVCPFLQGRGDSREFPVYKIDGVSAAPANRDDLLERLLPGSEEIWRKTAI